MRIRFRPFAFVLVASLCVFSFANLASANAWQEADAPETILVKGVRVFDGVKTIEKTDVLLQGGLIQQIDENIAPPTAATVVDGKGKTLLPGMIDCHVHVFFPMLLTQGAEFGVTTMLDMMGAPLPAERHREEQKAGKANHRSDYFSAGYAVTVEGGHGTQFGMKVPVLDSPEQAEAFVLARIREGSDYLKVIYEPGTAYGFTRPTLSEEMVKSTIQAAHKHDIKPVAHVSTIGGVELMVENGIAGLVHLNADEKLADEVIKKMVEKKIFVVPTVAVSQNITGPVTVDSLLDDPHVGPLLNGMDKKNLSSTFPENPNRLVNLESFRHNVLALETAGVPILAGTDAGNPGTTVGASMHHELELLIASGLTNEQALAAATSRAADCFELTDRGRIAKGLRADLILVEGNPLTDIKATRNIVSVWKGGYAIDREKRRATLERLRKKQEKLERKKAEKEASADK